MDAFESRASGCRTSHNTAFPSQDDLAICADIYCKNGPLRLVKSRCQNHAHSICAHEARDTRQKVNPSELAHLQSRLVRLKRHAPAESRHVRRYRQVLGIDTQKQVTHARVAHDDYLIEPASRHGRPLQQSADHPVDLRHDITPQPSQSSALSHRVVDAADDVLASAGLRIHSRRDRYLPAGVQIKEVPGYRCCSYVKCRPEALSCGVAPFESYRLAGRKDSCHAELGSSEASSQASNQTQ